MTTTAILGLGASGQAAARLALKQGDDVYVSDLKADAPARARGAELEGLGARVELGRHDLAWIARADTVVVSPGIPPDAPVLAELRRRGRRWVSEPEFAFRFFHGPLIAVTGTNGKTTVTLLIAHLLSEAGLRVGVGGNVGGGLAPPASELALMDPAPEWYVLEVSSFQLADVDTFAPDIGVVTSLAPDHLDRYPSVEAYYADKAHLFDNATPGSAWVLNGESADVLALPGEAPGRRFTFGRDPDAGHAAFVRDGVLTLAASPLPRFAPPAGGGEGGEALLPLAQLPLLGGHGVLNALAAGLVARLAGVAPQGIARGLGSARPLPHRLEPVAEAGGVLWVNDSKATNVAAAVGAIESLTRPLVLLLGGKDKGETLEPLAQAAREGVRLAVCFGAAGPRMAAALEGAGVPVERVEGGLDAAVAVARAHARPGEAVLLSPACSSFDEFVNYEARGDRFRDLVQGVAA